MSSLTKSWREHLRLTILRILAAAPGYSCNEALLHDVLRDDWKFGATRDQVAAELEWLAEQGLADVVELVGLKIATISGRGSDVAQGLAVVPGVRRPSPK